MEKEQSQTEPQLKKAGLVQDISLLGFTTELAIKLAVPVIVLSLVGRWIDTIAGTGMLWLVLGTVLGITIATVLTVKRVVAIIRQADKEFEEQKQEEKDKT